MRLRPRLVAVLVLCLAGFGAAWGQTVLSVRVVDEVGQPIEGAAVILRPDLQTPVELPPPFFTDPSGRVLIERLPEGDWQVEVRSAGYMIFSAYVKLLEGLPPIVGFTSKQRTGTFWAPLDVLFSGSAVSSEALSARASDLAKRERKQLKKLQGVQRAEERRAEKRARASAKRSPRSRGTEVARLEPVAPPARATRAGSLPTEQPQPSPVLEPVAEADVESELVAESRIALVEQQPEAVSQLNVRPVAEAELSIDVTRPERESGSGSKVERLVEGSLEAAADVPKPEAAEESASGPSSVPTIQSRPVLFHGGSCPECKSGEWALVVERKATVRSGTVDDCGQLRSVAVDALVDEVLRPAAAELEGFAGPLLDSYGNGVSAYLGRSEDTEVFRSLTAAEGPCQDFIAILPSDARFVGFRFEAVDNGGGGDCFGVMPCSIGEARWMANPEIERLGSMTVIHASFLNESMSRARRGRLIVLFVPARGWQAP